MIRSVAQHESYPKVVVMHACMDGRLDGSASHWLSRPFTRGGCQLLIA
jgi:hypothetical protein